MAFGIWGLEFSQNAKKAMLITPRLFSTAVHTRLAHVQQQGSELILVTKKILLLRNIA